MSARPSLGLCGAVVLAVLSLTGCRRVPAPEIAQTYAALALAPVGPTRYRPADLSGRVVLVSFFATWCFPCLAQLPSLRRLHEARAPEGLSVVMVGLDLEGERVLRPFAEMYALPFPVLVANDPMRDGRSPFGPITALPTTFLLDREGRVAAAWQGVAAPSDLERLVERLTAQ